MTRIRVRVFLPARPARVWAQLRDIGSHATWMQDAESIRFTSASTGGVGTTFECATRVGPFRLNDRMEVTAWEDRRVMEIRHVGIVSGTGRFTLRRVPGGTLFTWHERLRFPWWLGGHLTGLVAKPVLHHIWKGNLRRFKTQLRR